MCRAASFIVTKKLVLWSKTTDSHTDIRSENNLPEEADLLRIKTVAVEIYPENGDYNTPAAKWLFNVDQDALPGWWDACEAEERVRRSLKQWIKCRLVRNGECVTVKSGQSVIICSGGTVQKVWGGGTVQEVWGGGTVQEVWDGGTVQEVGDGGTVQKVGDGGTVQRVCGGGTVQEVWDGGTVQEVCGGGTVQKVWGGGTVQEVWGGGTVQAYTQLSPDILKHANAVLIDRSGSRVQVFVGPSK